MLHLIIPTVFSTAHAPIDEAMNRILSLEVTRNHPLPCSSTILYQNYLTSINEHWPHLFMACDGQVSLSVADNIFLPQTSPNSSLHSSR